MEISESLNKAKVLLGTSIGEAASTTKVITFNIDFKRQSARVYGE